MQECTAWRRAAKKDPDKGGILAQECTAWTVLQWQARTVVNISQQPVREPSYSHNLLDLPV